MLLYSHPSNKTLTCLKAKQVTAHEHYTTTWKLSRNLLLLIRPYLLLTIGNYLSGPPRRSQGKHGCFKEVEKAFSSQQCIEITPLCWGSTKLSCCHLPCPLLYGLPLPTSIFLTPDGDDHSCFPPFSSKDYNRLVKPYAWVTFRQCRWLIFSVLKVLLFASFLQPLMCSFLFYTILEYT